MLCLGTRRKKRGKENTQSKPDVNIEIEKHKAVSPVASAADVSIDLSSLEKAKRGELQKLCKEAGLKANGKVHTALVTA